MATDQPLLFMKRVRKMSELKLCQGPKCHQYNTKDRLKGTERQ